MNDTNFANYDNYFCTANHQVTDVNPLIQTMDYDMPQTIHYINNVSCDMAASTAPLSQTTSVDQRHHHQQQPSNIYTFLPHSQPLDEQENHENHSSILRGGVSTVSAAVSSGPTSSGVFGNIPFVQIHTTDVQPQRTSYGNVFRRNISKQEEIKSELIKSENSDAAKERINATPTPPRAPSQTQSKNFTDDTQSNTIERSSNNIENIDQNSASLNQIYKCSKCSYLSLSETDRDDHLSTQHGEGEEANNIKRQQINCPGCSNVFFVKQCLELHLKLDHFMNENDVLKLIDSLIKTIPKESENTSSSTPEPINQANNVQEHKEPQRKSRIYLKNVECLREPNRQPIEQRKNQLNEITNYNSSETTMTSNAPKQKISIKSVDVLREPALLRRDYEIQNSNLKNFLNFNTDMINTNLDIISNPIGLNVATGFEYSQNLDPSINNTNNLNNNDTGVINSNIATSNTDETPEKTRRPKIYVKSVESFNLMPLDTTHSNNTGFMNDHSNLGTNSQLYDSNMVHLPFMFDSSSPANNNLNNNNNNYISNHNDMDTFQFITNSNHNNNYILENSLFCSNNDDIITGSRSEQMESITILPEQTPTPPSIADINLQMNKPPQASQEQRGTLHLRTVDELNLMNKNDVQHLIAPNLDNNNHNNNEIIDKVNSNTSLHDINIIGAEIYDDDNFKFHDLDTQMANEWPEAYEDLADDINCIIADASTDNSADNLAAYTLETNQKISNNSIDIETPQVSLITIRDIEELTGSSNHQYNNSASENQQQDLLAEQIPDNNDMLPTEAEATLGQDNSFNLPPITDNDNNLKRELSNATPDSNDVPLVAKVNDDKNLEDAVIEKSLGAIQDIPPLAPVTNTSDALTSTKPFTNINSLTKNNDIPVPPLVPVSSMIKIKKPTTEAVAPVEKGRIYVANNLMEPPKRPVAVAATSGTSVRGRPFGSNRTRITKLKQTHGDLAEDLFSKCSIKGCAFRFKKAETVDYHRKCHDMLSDSPQAMLCPECKSTEFNNWNTLHTHLWRAHQIDMELYKCELCEFKTPIFSRLVNTHAKIHFDDRNYKCEQCDKAFKNSKQLKNHRRWHRVQSTVAATATSATNPVKEMPTEIYRCTDCGSTFAQQKTLREHCCKKGGSSLKCNVCEKSMSSKASLKLHLLTHSDGEKRYKCQNCDYATNDHNAFRRHRMGHENRKMYECSFCQYKSVQSVAYQKHILQKHPDKADTVIHKCNACTFSTINRSLLVVHQAKHEKSTNEDLRTTNLNGNANATEKSVSVVTEHPKSKIKVKSNLFTIDNVVTVENFNKNDVNLVQLYNLDNSIT